MFTKKQHYIFKWLVIFLMVLCLSVLSGTQTVAVISQNNSPETVKQIIEGRRLFENGKYQEAIKVLQETLKTLQKPEERLTKASVLSNLALIYQQLGQWSQVDQATTESLNLLKTLENSPQTLKVLASNLDIQGHQQLETGQSEKAFTTWQEAASFYEQIGDQLGTVRVNLNQAQALQSLGFYRRALKSLSQINQSLDNQPDSLTKVVAKRSLANTLQLVGDLEQAQKTLTDSLRIAQRLSLTSEISANLFSLGNLTRLFGMRSNSFDDPVEAQEQFKQALEYYKQAITASDSLSQTVAIYTNKLGLLLDSLDLQQKNPDLQQNSQSGPEIEALLSKIDPLLKQLPPSRPNIYAQINLAKNLTRLQKVPKSQITITQKDIELLLDVAIKQAQELEDERALSYAIGYRGTLKENQKEYTQAETLTQQALLLALNANARDIAYQWQWQLGRLLKNQARLFESIVAYDQAVETLKALRSDLVAINPEIQFTFTEQIEPIYREYIELLLRGTPKQQQLAKARETLDALQLAELENFFRATCLDAHPLLIDQVTDKDDPTSAILYPIILSDRFEMILKLPQQPLRHYTTPINDPKEIERMLNEFVGLLKGRNSDRQDILKDSQIIYDWLLKPLEQDLANSQIKTLVFVPDSRLRNIPMAALYDGENYLIEKYNLALIPQLYLFQPQPLVKKDLKVLTAGLTEPRGGFLGLPYVSQEFSKIQSIIPNSTSILNEDFTNKNLQKKINAVNFSILHLATHGQFSSQLENTFILTWDERLNANQLNELLRSGSGQKTEPLELLVLSACQTLAGDKRAALGLAGIAIRAGARSTLATLWSVNDEATSLLMGEFYDALKNPTITKAEALRLAQLVLFKNSRFEHPYYWAAYVLVGNWL